MNISKIGSLNREGEKILVRGYLEYERAADEKGKTFVKGSVTDDTGKLNFTVFDDTSWLKKLEPVPSGSWVIIKGKVVRLNAGRSKKLKIVDDVTEINIVNPELVGIDEIEVRKKLTTSYSRIKDPKLKKLVRNCMNKGKNGELLPARQSKKPFFISPLDEKIFDYNGGLSVYVARVLDMLEVNVEMLVNGNYLAEKKPLSLNKDLLIAAAMLHSVGSIACYEERKSKWVIKNPLVNRISMTRTIIEDEMTNLKFTYQERAELLHILSTCEKGQEYYRQKDGSLTVEAVLLNKVITTVLAMERYRIVSGDTSGLVTDNFGYLWFAK